MDKPSSSRPKQKSAPGRRVQLIPSTPRPGNAVIPPAQPRPLNTGVPQPPETFGGNLYANIIRETMGRWNRARLMAERGEESSEQTQNSTSSSSSSLCFSDGRAFDEIAEEVILEMQEEEREKMSGETHESKEPVIVISDEEGLPQEGPIREIPDLTGAEGKEKMELEDWETHMENTLNQLLIENASLNERLRAQEEQANQLFGIMERMVSSREEGTQASRQPLPENSSPSQDQPSRLNTEVHPTESSRKKRPSTTISQPTSSAKKTRKSGSKGARAEIKPAEPSTL